MEIAEWETTFQKQSSAVTYRKALKRFFVEWELAPSDLVRLPLSEIEDLTETFIHRSKRKISPKYLNVIYLAIKSWFQRAHENGVNKFARRTEDESKTHDYVNYTRKKIVQAPKSICEVSFLKRRWERKSIHNYGSPPQQNF